MPQTCTSTGPLSNNIRFKLGVTSQFTITIFHWQNVVTTTLLHLIVFTVQKQLRIFGKGFGGNSNCQLGEACLSENILFFPFYDN